MPSPLKLKQKPTTPREALGMGSGLIGTALLIAFFNGSAPSYEGPFLVLGTLGVLACIATVRHERLESGRRRRRVLAQDAFPARITDIQSSWPADGGEPLVKVTLCGLDGSDVGGAKRWHHVEPPPHWVSQLEEGTTLVIRWGDDLEHAFVDWDASNEYRADDRS